MENDIIPKPSLNAPEAGQDELKYENLRNNVRLMETELAKLKKNKQGKVMPNTHFEEEKKLSVARLCLENAKKTFSDYHNFLKDEKYRNWNEEKSNSVDSRFDDLYILSSQSVREYSVLEDSCQIESEPKNAVGGTDGGSIENEPKNAVGGTDGGSIENEPINAVGGPEAKSTIGGINQGSNGNVKPWSKRREKKIRDKKKAEKLLKAQLTQTNLKFEFSCFNRAKKVKKSKKNHFPSEEFIHFKCQLGSGPERFPNYNCPRNLVYNSPYTVLSHIFFTHMEFLYNMAVKTGQIFLTCPHNDDSKGVKCATNYFTKAKYRSDQPFDEQLAARLFVLSKHVDKKHTGETRRAKQHAGTPRRAKLHKVEKTLARCPDCGYIFGYDLKCREGWKLVQYWTHLSTHLEEYKNLPPGAVMAVSSKMSVPGNLHCVHGCDCEFDSAYEYVIHLLVAHWAAISEQAVNLRTIFLSCPGKECCMFQVRRVIIQNLEVEGGLALTEMFDHLRRWHTENEMTPEHCPQCFTSTHYMQDWEFWQHLAQHADIEAYFCQACQMFVSRKLVDYHLQSCSHPGVPLYMREENRRKMEMRQQLKEFGVEKPVVCFGDFAKQMEERGMKSEQLERGNKNKIDRVKLLKERKALRKELMRKITQEETKLKKKSKQEKQLQKKLLSRKNAIAKGIEALQKSKGIGSNLDVTIGSNNNLSEEAGESSRSDVINIGNTEGSMPNGDGTVHNSTNRPAFKCNCCDTKMKKAKYLQHLLRCVKKTRKWPLVCQLCQKLVNNVVNHQVQCGAMLKKTCSKCGLLHFSFEDHEENCKGENVTCEVCHRRVPKIYVAGHAYVCKGKTCLCGYKINQGNHVIISLKWFNHFICCPQFLKLSLEEKQKLPRKAITIAEVYVKVEDTTYLVTTISMTGGKRVRYAAACFVNETIVKVEDFKGPKGLLEKIKQGVRHEASNVSNQSERIFERNRGHLYNAPMSVVSNVSREQFKVPSIESYHSSADKDTRTGYWESNGNASNNSEEVVNPPVAKYSGVGTFLSKSKEINLPLKPNENRENSSMVNIANEENNESNLVNTALWCTGEVKKDHRKRIQVNLSAFPVAESASPGFTCQQCGTHFSQERILKFHMAMHINR